MMMSQFMGGAHGGRVVPILDQIKAEFDKGKESVDKLRNVCLFKLDIY